MRVFDLGSNFNVAVSEDDIDRFNDRWPASELRGLRGVTFQFKKRNGDLIDIWYKNGNSDRWDGPALLALSQDAQEYGEARIKSGGLKSAWPATYTTAPADYDWFGTFLVAIVGKDNRGRDIRRVRSDPSHVQSQRDRYASGLHMAVDETEWKKLVKYELVTKTKPELEENPPDAYMNWRLSVQRRVGPKLVREHDRDLRGLFLAGESPEAAAKQISRYRSNASLVVFENPVSGVVIAVGALLAAGVGYFLLRDTSSGTSALAKQVTLPKCVSQADHNTAATFCENPTAALKAKPEALAAVCAAAKLPICAPGQVGRVPTSPFAWL